MNVLTIKETDRILIVSPHPDDESLGCGGLIALYPNQTDVMLISDGRLGHGKEISDADCSIIRKNEIQKALKAAGSPQLIELGLPDGEINQFKKEIIKQDITGYKYIFIPNREEGHRDHKAVNKFFRKMYRIQCDGKKTLLLEYEVWHPLRYTDIVLDISSVFSIKENMVKQYSSQLQLYDYNKLHSGLCAYRGAIYHTDYAETYQISSKRHVCESIRKQLFQRKKNIKRLFKGLKKTIKSLLGGLEKGTKK